MIKVTDTTLALIQNSDLFDADWYSQQFPDVSTLEISPAEHYLTLGWRLGREPSAQFNSAEYLRLNPDAATAGISPLLHYLTIGKAEKRPLVCPVKQAEANLLAYVQHRATPVAPEQICIKAAVSAAQLQGQLERYFLKTRQLELQLRNLQQTTK